MTPYDWTPEDCAALATMVRNLGLTDARPWVAVWAHESDLDPRAHNPGGASGLCQFEPATLRGLGYDAEDRDLSAFRALSASAQMPWCERYYRGGRQWCSSVAGCYLWTFLPAQAHLCGSPLAIVCARWGPYADAYRDNCVAFDAPGTGRIQVSDLTDAAARSWGPRAAGILARVEAAPTEPTLPPEHVLCTCSLCRAERDGERRINSGAPPSPAGRFP